VIPAIAALIAANYEGRERALAHGLIGGVAAAAVAAGPLIGGWVTTTFTWRLIFAGETVVVVGILLTRHKMQPSPRPEHPPRVDVVGAVLSASGRALVVFGVLQSSSWGWVQARDALTIAGVAITPLGFSAVPFLVLGGMGPARGAAERARRGGILRGARALVHPEAADARGRRRACRERAPGGGRRHVLRDTRARGGRRGGPVITGYHPGDCGDPDPAAPATGHHLGDYGDRSGRRISPRDGIR